MQLSLFHTGLSSDEEALYGLLRHGRDNAVSVKALEAATGMAGVEIRKIIRRLIMDHGLLIGSSVNSPPGYYIPETADEAITATKSLRHRGIMILMRAAKLQRCSVELVFNQARLEFDEVKK